MANDAILQTYSQPTIIVPAIMVGVAAGGAVGDVNVLSPGSSRSIQTNDRVLFVTSSGTTAGGERAYVGLGDAYSENRSASSASVTGVGTVGLDFATSGLSVIVYYVSSAGTAS